MPAVFVIHTELDEAFVTEHLLPPLPALGFDHWISADSPAGSDEPLPGAAEPPSAVADAIRASAAILAVLSDAARRSPAFRAQVALALRSGRPFIPVVGISSPESWDDSLAAMPAAATAEAVNDPVLWANLAALLPPPDRADSSVPEPRPGVRMERIPWSEPLFSQFLKAAVDRHDYNRGDALVFAFERHLATTSKPYSVPHARTDLAALRKKRQFALMRRYAAATIAAATTDLRVRRQYAQALIELGELRAAVSVLEGVIAGAPVGDPESYEARGLLGRVYKQEYVNAPHAAGAAALVERAIESYGSVFNEDDAHVWHGINAVSLLLRAARDGVKDVRTPEAPAMAKRILDVLSRRREEKGGDAENLEVWDHATCVEANLALGSYEAAARALDEYLAHPDMDAFEVSSTYRQFDEVLRLSEDPRARPLLERLWSAVERHRGGGSRAPADESVIGAEASAGKPMLLRVSDPDWQPSDVPDLDIDARLGTVLSITGTERTIKALMRDPLVVSVDESRPSQQVECSRSLPFIKVSDPYTGPTGPFTEKGDRALVAIIDDGIDVLHHAFLDGSGHSRIVGIWDQRGSGESPPGFDFGTYYSDEQIAGYVEKNGDPAATTTPIPAALTRNPDGHGTHVASIAAGRGAGAFAGGVAPDARLLIVISGGGEATGYSKAHLAALTFIDQTASSLGLPVVVNVSQGMNAGAHDGKSLVEVAFDEFSKGGRTPGRVIVKSAGNERDTNGHAEVSLLPDSATALRWTCRTRPDHVGPPPLWLRDRIELWWSSANEFRFRLREPNGQTSEWVDTAQAEANGKLRGVSFKLQLVRRHVDNGDSRLTVEVGTGFTPIPAGTWAIEIESLKILEAGAIHAWIERRADSRSEFLKHANENMTLSIPGTAYSVITVAAIDACKPIVTGDFSSFGPTRDGRRKPDVSAPGVSVIAARGGTFDDAVQMSGTSMAAPHVTGAIALVLSKAARTGQEWPTATQIGAVLRQKTSNYNGLWTEGQGYGVVDVAAILNAFD
jgi:endonuclease G